MPYLIVMDATSYPGPKLISHFRGSVIDSTAKTNNTITQTRKLAEKALEDVSQIGQAPWRRVPSLWM